MENIIEFKSKTIVLAVNDIDISTDATPEETLSLFDIDNFKVIQTGFSHGTITVISAGIPYQITTMRTDQNTDGRHADVRFSDNITEDAKRRDFTINGLYFDIKKSEVIDFVDGLNDLKELQINMIGNPSERFEEDPVRMIRAVRFKVKLSAKIDKKLNNIIIKNSL